MAEEYVGRKFRTKFLSKFSAGGSAAESIVAVGRKLNEMGLTPENAGNISVRTEKGMLITPGGKNKGQLTPGGIVEVREFKNRTAHVVGSVEPSSEVPMHWLIYQKYPKVNAVIHAHDSLAVKNPLGLVVTDRVHPYGTLSQARDVVEALGKSNYIVIRRHGVVAVGATLEEAFKLIQRVYCR
ncbi:MAG: class II aldolase/adducin family protein [Candidatus Altiarchaeota archaeon]